MTIRNLLLSFLSTVIAVWCCSCGGTSKFSNMVYLADSVKESQTIASQYEYTLKPGDRIQILVTALNQEAAMAFNVTPIITTAGSSVTSTNNISATGYLIDPQGYIQFPQKGNIKAAGMTINEVGQHIKSIISDQLKDPVVIVNISNFKVNVLGEVAKPGSLTVPDGKITILEALSQTGDLTIYGKRENILVIREKDGKRDFGKVNLASKSLFESPYYHLEQGDVVYVEMNKNKLLLSDAEESRRLRYISLVLTAVTAIGVLITAISRF